MSPLSPSPGLRPPARRVAECAVGLAALAASAAFAASAEAHPFVSVNPPVSATSSPVVPFSARAHTGSSRLRSVSFYVDGRRIFVDRAARWRVPGGVDTRRLSNGRHRFRARALFANGASKTSERIVTVRNGATTSAPKVSWKAPTAGATVSGDLRGERCEVTVDRPSAVARIDFRLDGRFIGDQGTAPYNCELDTRSVADGTHTLSATAYDRYGRSSQASTEIKVSNAPADSGSSEPPSSTPNPPLWGSDFEGGVTASWLGAQWDPDVSMSERIQSVSDISRTGDRSARFSVRSGDSVSGTARAQLYGAQLPSGSELRFREGDDYYFGFSMRLAADYPMDEHKWQQLVSFMRDGSGQGPLKLGTSFERDSFRLEGPDGDKVYWRGPIEKGGWLDFVFRVRFSTDPSKGFIEVWYKRPSDGQLVRQTLSNGNDRLYVNTMAAGSSFSYLKAGVYRDQSFTAPSTVWYDSFRIGRALADVAPR
jgi:hypothetical protein